MKLFPLVVTVAASLCLVCPARAESPGDVPNPQQARRSFVADNADVLDAATERKLDDLINGVKKRTGAEIAVVTVRSLGGYKVEDFANLLFNRWGIGRKSDDDGVLILAAINDRKLRIEVGDGAESVITDGVAGGIIRNTIGPRFKAGDFNGGLYDGTLAVAKKLDSSLQNQTPAGGAPVPKTPNNPPPSSSGSPSSGSPSSGSPSSGSPFEVPSDPVSSAPPSFESPAYEQPYPSSGGGGLPLGGPLLLLIFLGGGGVLTAMYLGSRPPKCPQCQTPMELLPEAEEDVYLSDIQQLEESLGGREWNVWRCPKDAFQAIMKHDKWLSSVSDCPRCGNRTVTSQSQTLRYATEFQSGLEQSTHLCHNPQCRHNWTTQRRIPRVQPVVIVSGGGGSSRSSSSRSGSSRSSGGGSFGGGHSSGGGASGGW